MRFVFLFVLLLFGSVSSWAGCGTQSDPQIIYSSADIVAGNCESMGMYSLTATCSAMASSGACNGLTYQAKGLFYTRFGYSSYFSFVNMGGSNRNCQQSNTCFSAGGSASLACYSNYACDSKCEADSVACLQNPDAVWDSKNCHCGGPTPPPPDTTYVCQNSGGPSSEEGGFGSPRKALLFACSGELCLQTRELAGTCQDWGFCEDGEDNCTIPKSKGSPPCGRSGPTFTTSTRCYYACADGKDLSCKPISTGYVAGNVYAGECPGDPPDGCRPSSSSSGSSASSSSDSGLSSDSSVPPPSDTISFPNDGSEDYEIDYTAILQAIHDTLHRANVQRDFLVDLQNAAKLDLDNISSYNEYIYNSVDGVEGALKTGNSSLSTIASATTDFNNSLSTLQENGFNLVSSTANDISQSHELLDEINRYLRSDSLYTALPLDTVYNPLLRDIKGAIDSINTGHDTTRFVRDSAFARWFAAYYSDTASRVGVLGDIYENTKTLAGDSSKNSSCAAFLSCYTPNPTLVNAQACAVSTGGSLVSCVDGGSPLDNLVNVELGVLKTLWNGLFGSDSTVTDTESSDTNVTFSPAKDSATNSMMGAIRALFSSDSTASILNKVKEMRDSIEKRNNDSTVIQPDSLVLDSSEAAQYVQNLLLVPGTSEDCFICHADLGTFGGLVPNGLSIHIDFADFGGFNFCALIRAVVKIASLVVCISLTLGSWLAAFGYNPKNDA